MKNRILYFLLLPIPVVWALLHWVGALDDLRNQGMDLRFRMRGELPSPARIIYADLDSAAMNLPFVGERPWDRRFFADVGMMVMEYGGAAVVGFDFVFSPKSMSRMVPDENILRSDRAIAGLVERYPDRVILAADYTGLQLEYMNRPSRPPMRYLGYRNPSGNAYPEAPTFPMVRWQDGKPIGRIGIISVDEVRSGGSIPRWAPVYYEYEGEDHIRNVIHGMQFAYRVQGLETEVREDGEEMQVLLHGDVMHTFPRRTEMRFHHFSLELFLAAEGLDATAVHPFPDRLEVRRPDGSLRLSIPLEDEQLVEINWFTRWNSPLNERVSIAELYYHAERLFSENPDEVAEAEAFYRRFENAIVLVGPVDRLLQDLAPTPFDPREVPKVGVHGNLLKTYYSARFIRRLPEGSNVVFLLGLSAICVASSLYSGRFNLIYKLASIFIVLAYVAVVLVFFAMEDLVLPLVAPVGAALSTMFVGVVGKLVIEERQKGRIKSMFGTYLSPQLVEEMVQSGREPQLGGHEAEITAFFSDIQSFSTFSERLAPYDLVELMNEYLTEMTNIIHEENGTLDKYIGDAIVAMFGAPIPLEAHGLHACRSALRIQARQVELQGRWRALGERWPDIVHEMQTRVGLHSGPAIVGNIGSESRFNYTMMGDTVNLAARSESGAKSYGVYTMVTEETRNQCDRFGSGEILFRYLDRIIVKGRSRPVAMFEAVDFQENISPDVQKGIDLFHEGIEHYLTQRWQQAESCFRESAKWERFDPEKISWVETNPSLVMIERSTMMRKDPPPSDWDGVYRMTTK